MSTGAFRSPGATLEDGSGGPDVLLRITTDGPHVCVVRTGRLAPPRPRPKTRNLCGRKIAEVDGPPVCPRCRASVGKLAANIMRREGVDAQVAVDGRSWPIWVLRVISPPFLTSLAEIDPPAHDEPVFHWSTMRSEGSQQTHVASTRLRVTDGTRWFQATDHSPIQTICLRRGTPDPQLSAHPDHMCTACSSSRDRMLLQAVPATTAADDGHDGQPVVVADGDAVAPLLADRSRLVVAASMTPVDGGHARLDWLLRPDARLDRAHTVGKAMGITPGATTLCGSDPGDDPGAVTPAGGCRRCAGSAGRIGLVVSRQWPGTRAAVLVDGRVVPTDVFGGDRVRLADPAFHPHIRPRGDDARAPDRIECCTAVSAASRYARVRLHLGWQQRGEQTGWGHLYEAALPHPAATLCGQQAAPVPAAADVEALLPCEACAAKALRPLTRMGRHAPDRDTPLEIIGSTYDDAVVELMGEAFAIAMLCDDMIAHVAAQHDAGEGAHTASDR